MGLGYVGGSTKCEIRLFPSETSSTGNSRTVKLAFDAKVRGGSGSWFGYPVDYKVWIHGSSTGWHTLKGNEKWTGGDSRRQFSQTLTVDVGTSKSVSIRVGVELRCSGASWNGSYMEDFWVSQTNVAPGQPGWISIRTGAGAPPLSGIISEAITQFYIDWGAVTDPNGDTVTYTLQEERNQNGSWSTIDTGTDTAHAFWTTGGEGTSYKYSVVAGDGKEEGSWRTSNLVTKNVFTMATLTSSSSVHADASPLTFSYSGGHNTQSGVSVTYKLDCNEVTLYNGNNFGSGGQVQIVKGGGSVSGPYIKWSDIVSRFSDSGGIGTLTFVLTGINSNGTQKSSEITIDVNVQSKPSGVGGATIVRNSSESPGYRKIKSSNNYYFLPDGTSSRSIRVKWNSVSGNYGDEITYTLFISYGNGGWEEVASGLRQTYYDHVIPVQSAERPFKYLIRAVSSANGNLYSDSQTGTETLHYYKDPTLIVNEIVRTANKATINLRVYTMTSIPNVSTIGKWSATGGQGGTLRRAQAPETITVTGLAEDSVYNLTVTYDDDSGFSSGQKTSYVPISANKPVFYVNKHGVGIGGEKADSTYALRVTGGTLIEKGAQINGGLIIGGVEDSNVVAGNSVNATTPGGDANDLWRSGFYSFKNGTNYPKSGDFYLLNVAHVGNSKYGKHNLQIAGEVGTEDFYIRSSNYKNSGGNWRKIYHSGNKPTAKEIGALPKGTTAADIGALPKGTTAADIGALPSSASALDVDALPIIGGYIRGDVHINSSNGARNLGYMGRGGDTQSEHLILRGTRHIIEFASSYRGGAGSVYLDQHGYLRPKINNDWSLGHGSQRWSSIYYTTLSAASDLRLKEKVKYLTEEATTLETDNVDLTSADLYNFVKDDLKIASYDYIQRKKEDEDKFKNKLGFIAQDIVKTKVGSRIIKKDKIEEDTAVFSAGDESLSYDLTDYVNVLAGALKTAIQEIETLKIKIIELETK